VKDAESISISDGKYAPIVEKSRRKNINKIKPCMICRAFVIVKTS